MTARSTTSARCSAKIGHLCDYVLWDEAWIGYNAFHPLFQDHSPMRLEPLDPEMPGLFSTQSVHKQLAGFSQASQIHKRDEHIRGQKRYVEHKRFNESFMMNASTSPFYPLFASLDVNAKVHEGKAGEMLWDRCIALGHRDPQEAPRVRRATTSETGKSDAEQWFFDPFVPDVVTIRGSRVHRRRHGRALGEPPDRRHQAGAAVLELPSGGAWHGYCGFTEGYAMVDPNKLALLTPGIDRKTGEYLDFGVPATVVANYLREQHVVPEKCDLNSILFLMTPAEDESKLNTLIAKLVKFKDLWDRDAMLDEVLPTLSAAHAERYAGYTLRAVCNEMHAFYREENIKELQRLCFRAASFPELAMSPKDAYEALVANEVDYIPLQKHQGPHLRNARPDLPARHRRHRPRRALGRQGAADARLLHGIRGVVQSLPGLQLRGPGRVSGTGRRPHQVPHLRGPRLRRPNEGRGRRRAMAAQKKMNLIQLTFIVAVNMMGSGIIMLPTNMAKVGAISLLSWMVTAVGSMAIAYGFAQAGLFNQRTGGMAAYARGRLRQVRAFSSCSFSTSCRWRSAMSRSAFQRSAIWRRSSPGSRRRRSRPASASSPCSGSPPWPTSAVPA